MESHQELQEAQSEIARLRSANEALETAQIRGRAERVEADQEVVSLKKMLEVATNGLEKEKTASGTLCGRLETLERELNLEKERVKTAEEEAEVQSAAASAANAALAHEDNSANKVKLLQTLVDERGAEVDELRVEINEAWAKVKAAEIELRAAKEEAQAQALEMESNRKKLGTERDSSARVSIELQVRWLDRCLRKASDLVL